MGYPENVKSSYTLPISIVEEHAEYFKSTKDFPVLDFTPPATVIKKPKGRLLPSRYICVSLGFLSCILLTTQRLNISMGMVAMVNNTGLHHHMGGNITHSECPLPTAHSEKEEDQPRVIEGHLLWHTETQNHIVSASFFGYVLTQIPGGRMSETYGGKQVLIFSLILASICNVISPLASDWGSYALMAAQFIKGLAQGMTQPAISCLMARWYPTPEKGFLSSLTLSGYPFGAVLGGYAIGAMCDSEFMGGWPMGFYVFGLLGLFLALLVYKFAFNCPDEDYAITEREYKYIVTNIESRDTGLPLKTPWKPMASTVGTWALLLGMFGQYWMTFYFVSVHPTYLGTVLHFTNTESGYLNSLPYLGQLIVTWLSSYFSDQLVNKGYASTDSVRKICNSISCIGFSVSFLLVTYVGCDKMLNIVLFVIAMTSVGFGFPGSNIVPLDMTIAYAGTLMGIGSTFASCSGFIIPLVAGSLTSQQKTLGQWHKVFYISSGVGFISGLAFALLGSAKLQNWESANADENKSTGLDNEGFEGSKEDIFVVDVHVHNPVSKCAINESQPQVPFT